jgi:hypothetical protein
MKIIDSCRHCGASNNHLRWHCGQKNTSGVVDGRLRMHDVSTIFYLGCEQCSETLQVVSGDTIAEYLNTNKPKAAVPPVTELQVDKLYLVIDPAHSFGEIDGKTAHFEEKRRLIQVLPKPDRVRVKNGETEVEEPTPEHLKQPEWYAVRNVIGHNAYWLNITGLHITEFTEDSL